MSQVAEQLQETFCVDMRTAARLLGVSKMHAHRLLKGKIIDLGERQKRVRLEDLKTLIAERTV